MTDVLYEYVESQWQISFLMQFLVFNYILIILRQIFLFIFNIFTHTSTLFDRKEFSDERLTKNQRSLSLISDRRLDIKQPVL